MNDGSQSTPTETAEPRRSGALAELLRGREIGRYVVLNKLGEGGMGVVVAAYDPELDRKVAIKLLHTGGGRGSDAGRRRLLAEAQALARLNDPNVVAVHDVGTHEGHVFVAMEFVEGQTLRKWLDTQPRPWTQVLDVMLSAGKGLAAAHARGLAHRDFKPGNVMLGDDDRVRVMDFGLALAQEDSSSVDEPDDSPVKPRERALGQALTQAGKLLGTPAYMAPEQLSGQRGGPGADQFSFCVSLWEALHGQRPFAGETLQTLFSRVLVGRIDEPPRTVRVPRWLRRVVEKGLAVDPERRWSSMTELLGALERGRARGRWRGVLALGLMGAVGVTLLVATDERARCSGGRAKLEGIWDGATRTAMAAAFGSTDMPYAEDARRSTEQTLDAYAERWVELRTEICEATRVRGDQSEALMDLRVGCLDGKRRDVAALTALLADADTEVIENAAQAAQALPTIEECVTLERDVAERLQPTDPVLATAVEGVREQTARARALSMSGKDADARTVATAALEAARQTGYQPAIAEAVVILGELGKLTSATAAREAYEAALYAAAASDHDRIEAEALLGLLEVWGVHLHDTERALAYGRHAEAVIQRLGHPPDLDAGLALCRGNTLRVASRFEAALAELERAVERSDGVPAAERIHLAALNNLAVVQGQQGRYRESSESSVRSLRLAEARLGPWHPVVGTNHLNLGVTYAHLEEHDRALEHINHALEIYGKSLGSDHPEMGRAYHSLGIVQGASGAVQAAYESYAKGLEIKQRALGPDHPSVAFTANNVGDALIKLGRPHEAIPYCEDALRIWTKALGEDNSINIYALISLSEAHLALGEPRKAELPIRRALALGEVGEIDPLELAKARFIAARAMWAGGGDREEARSLAERAKRDYAASERAMVEELAAIEAWLAEPR